MPNRPATAQRGAFGARYASGGSVDVTITPGGSPSAPVVAANSAVPPPTGGSTANPLPSGMAASSNVPPPTAGGGLGAATPNPQPAFNPTPYAGAAANVPVGGTSGPMNSPYASSVGPNGMPMSMPNSGVVAQPGANGMIPGGAPPPNSIANPIAPYLKRGGTAKDMASGGTPTSEALSPWYARQADREMMQPEGMIRSTGAGRTDIHNINVPAGSYVVPADVVSGLGEGNTLAGSAVMDRMMHSNPYGIQGQKSGARSNIPHPPAPFKDGNALPAAVTGPLEKRGGQIKRAEGGGTQQPVGGHGEPVPIVIAGGEFLVHPQTIIKKFGSLEKGHKTLDAFVVKVRKDTAKKMLKLPGPKK